MIHLSFFIPDSSVEVLAFQTQEVIARLDDTAFRGDGTCRVDIVTSDHAHSNTCSLAFPDSVRDLKRKKNGGTQILQINYTYKLNDLFINH